MKGFTMVNRFIERFRTREALEGEIKGGENFGGRELCVEEEERI
jgi:hypothetical protein